MKIPTREAGDDPVHAALKAAEEVETTGYLWVKGDTNPFTPRVSPVIYGDGRALFTISTINQRPRYWIIRGCSSWGCGLDTSGDGPDFAEFTDEILTDLEEHFGNGRCGYCGNSLFWPREERLVNCQCEDCDDEWVAEWPVVDGDGGCSWGRMDWPADMPTVKNPVSWIGSLLLATPPSPNLSVRKHKREER